MTTKQLTRNGKIGLGIIGMGKSCRLVELSRNDELDDSESG